MPQTIALITPVKMRVDLHDGNRAVAFECLKKRDRHGVIAAKKDRDSPRRKNPGGSSADHITIAFRRAWTGQQIAAVTNSDLAMVQEGAGLIEIPTGQVSGRWLDCATKGIGRLRCMAWLPWKMRSPFRRPQHDN